MARKNSVKVRRAKAQEALETIWENTGGRSKLEKLAKAGVFVKKAAKGIAEYGIRMELLEPGIKIDGRDLNLFVQSRPQQYGGWQDYCADIVAINNPIEMSPPPPLQMRSLNQKYCNKGRFQYRGTRGKLHKPPRKYLSK